MIGAVLMAEISIDGIVLTLKGAAALATACTGLAKALPRFSGHSATKKDLEAKLQKLNRDLRQKLRTLGRTLADYHELYRQSLQMENNMHFLLKLQLPAVEREGQAKGTARLLHDELTSYFNDQLRNPFIKWLEEFLAQDRFFDQKSEAEIKQLLKHVGDSLTGADVYASEQGYAGLRIRLKDLQTDVARLVGIADKGIKQITTQLSMIPEAEGLQ